MLNRRQFFSLPYSAGVNGSDYWLHLNRRAMACRFEITLPANDQSDLSAANEALNLIDRLEDQMTVFRETSEISHINRNAGSTAIEVEAGLFGLLVMCEELYYATNGAFDITAGPLTRCWGFLRREGRIPEPDELEAARSRVGMHKILLDRGKMTVRFSHPGIEINLGSIGKGYALDRVDSLMRGRGVGSALVSGGGSSLIAIGTNGSGDGWAVGIRHPVLKNGRIAKLALSDRAVATSSSAEQYFEKDGKRYGHIIDPRSGVPATGILSVTVIAPSGALADALATAFFIEGRKLAEHYCSTHPEILVLMIEEDSPGRPVIIGEHSRCRMEILE
jgi:FAD:protein FMN transferase